MSWNLEEAISYYKAQGAPNDQNALISLLREVQAENGGVPQYSLPLIAEACGIKESFLYAIIKRIPSLRLKNTHCLELCAGPNCGKHTALAACAEALCASQGNINLKFVPCMRMCGKGPNIKWDGVLYHRATEELLRTLVTEETGK